MHAVSEAALVGVEHHAVSDRSSHISTPRRL